MDIFKEYIIKDNLVLLPKYFRPIHYAFYHNSYNIILYLVSMGENIIYKGNCEISPLDTRQKYYKISISQLNILSADYKSLKEYISLNKAKRNDECCICLDDIYNKKIVKLKCGHIFHKSCLIKSMKNTKLCPYCRSEIEIEHYVYNNLGDVVLKNEIKKVKRRKSETDFISNNLKNKTINKKKYYESEDIEFIKLENTCFRNIMNTKFEILKNKLEKNQKERDLKLIRQILIKSKHISKKQKVVGKYKTPPPTPIPEIRKFKNELEKLKEIHISIEIDINYVRKSRNNKINRLTY